MGLPTRTLAAPSRPPTAVPTRERRWWRGQAEPTGPRVQEARRIADQLIEQARVRHLPALDVARVHAGLGDREQTLIWLERAYAKREQNLDLIFLRVDPMWDLVRAEPRFQRSDPGHGIPPLVVGG